MTALLAARIGVACLILALVALVTDHLPMFARLFAAGLACGDRGRVQADRSERFRSEDAMKHCPTCGETKPLEDFYRCKSRGDGRTGRCRLCHDAAVERTRAASPEKYREIARLSRRKSYQRRKRTVVDARAKWGAIAAAAAAEA